ncbi:hypothetical protein RhiJN_23307 [Ceratobasidium sp. AG-Ba]|nr:hypothetical protein RhiJN_23307 [Ceratobasidium sp. AG-Ba]
MADHVAHMALVRGLNNDQDGVKIKVDQEFSPELLKAYVVTMNDKALAVMKSSPDVKSITRNFIIRFPAFKPVPVDPASRFGARIANRPFSMHNLYMLVGCFALMVLFKYLDYTGCSN